MTLAVTTTLLSACLVSLLAQAVVRDWLLRSGLLDYPNHRSSHSKPVPRGGGIGIAVGMLVGLSASIQSLTTSGQMLTVSIALLCIGYAAVGLVDDRRPLPVRTRLVAQFVLAVLIVAAFATSLGIPRGTTLAAMVVMIVGLFWIPAYTNAFNFMDGINGIAGLQGVLAGGFFAWVGLREGMTEVAVLGVATAGACMGFLPWNMPRARLFMGDAGSYAVGSLLACMSLWLWWQGVAALVCLAPLSVFLADSGWTLVRRLVGRRPWREAHREHVYQRLVDGGWPQSKSAGLATVVAAIVSAAALVGDDDHGVTVGTTAGTLAIVMLMGYLGSPAILTVRNEGVSGSLR